MSHLLKQLADGRWVRADGSPDEVVRDGETIRMPMVLLDSMRDVGPDVLASAAHQRPRQGSMSQADSQTVADARTKYIERSQNAWKDAGPLPSVKALEATREPFHPQPFVPQARTGDEGTAAYENYKRRLEDGYRHAKSSAPGRI